MAVLNEGAVTPWRTLYISAVLGGGGAMADVERAIRRLAGIVRREEETHPFDDPAREAAVDVTYHLCGPILRPDYEGMRTGRWVKDKRLLVVQVAVPEAVSGSGEVNSFLGRSLIEAVELAGRHLDKKQLGLSLDRAVTVAGQASLALEQP